MKVANQEIKSVLELRNLYFETINFERDKEQPNEIETSFDTEYNNLSECDIEVKLKCFIKSTTFNINIVLVGHFTNTEEDINYRETINKVNTVSIMFPYMRSEISLLTAQPNFPTIDLPIVNINALLENKGKLIGKINN